MAILDIIEFFDETGDIMVAKIPQEGSAEFRMGSQLIVQENQTAVFFRDGRALDMFEAGRHTLTTQNLPLLTKLLSLPYGGKSPFRCYVYFLALKTFINLGWGTPTPVLFRDSDFRMVTLRAHGSYSLKIAKPRTFMQTLVGTKGLETTFALEEYFRSLIVSRFNEVTGTTMKSILDLPAQYNNIALGVKKAVGADMEQYGLYLVDLVVEAITVPPEVQEMINKATGIAAQDVDKYRSVAAADAMMAAAKNPSGPGEGMSAGMGLGMGFGMAREFAQGMGLGASAPAAAPAPAGGAQPGRLSADEIKAKLKDLKGMKDDGLITEADFEEQKKRLLSQM
ncbi:MAG TPA: SPFH domain-containing protein [Candidatus Brocadiia bacterium]|nr:SPFH domain-containing protein [Candidatus Brocadiia bacterium]